MIIIGEKLSPEIASIIRDSSTADQRRTICNNHNLSIDLMNALLRRDRGITADNEKLIKDLISECKKNARRNLKQLEKI